jgi:hypothetical protein
LICYGCRADTHGLPKADQPDTRQKALQDALAATNARASRLTDLQLDGNIDTPVHDEKRTALVMERHRLEQELAALGTEEAQISTRVQKILGLAKCAKTLYETTDAERKRRLLEAVTSAQLRALRHS